MKNKLKELVVNILTWESGVILKRFEPEVIAITGNVGKTTTKDFIWSVLRGENIGGVENVRAAHKSQNSEFGVCLTILGEKNAWNNILAWGNMISVGFLKTYFNKNYPKTLILEVGADHPGDIKHITSFVKPDIVVLTAFQEIPTHGEYFKSITQHIREKKYLIDALKKGGKIIYNADDRVMTAMAKEKLEKEGEIFCEIFSFGKSQGADVQIIESGNFYNSESEVEGTRVKLLVKEKIVEIELFAVLGEAQNYALAAAVLVDVLKGMNVEDVNKCFNSRNWEPTQSRMRILRGLNNLIIVDDSYNASPLAVENAIETIAKTFCKGKKIIVLGHMAELGESNREAHMQIGKMAAEIANVIIFSGRCNEHYLDGVRLTKFSLEKVFLAEDAEDVIGIINKNKILNSSSINDAGNINNLMLVKGSQSARLEKVVAEFLFDKRDTEKVCRQDEEWKKR